MNRRTALTIIAATPLVALLDKPAEADTIDYYLHTIVWRQNAHTDKTMFDPGEPTEIGTVYEGFHEVWAVRTGDGKWLYRVSQEPAGKYRIVSREEQHSWTFSDYDNIHRFACDDPNAIHLQGITS